MTDAPESPHYGTLRDHRYREWVTRTAPGSAHARQTERSRHQLPSRFRPSTDPRLHINDRLPGLRGHSWYQIFGQRCRGRPVGSDLTVSGHISWPTNATQKRDTVRRSTMTASFETVASADGTPIAFQR